MLDEIFLVFHGICLTKRGQLKQGLGYLILLWLEVGSISLTHCDTKFMAYDVEVVPNMLTRFSFELFDGRNGSHGCGIFLVYSRFWIVGFSVMGSPDWNRSEIQFDVCYLTGVEISVLMCHILKECKVCDDWSQWLLMVPCWEAHHVFEIRNVALLTVKGILFGSSCDDVLLLEMVVPIMAGVGFKELDILSYRYLLILEHGSGFLVLGFEGDCWVIARRHRVMGMFISLMSLGMPRFEMLLRVLGNPVRTGDALHGDYLSKICVVLLSGSRKRKGVTETEIVFYLCEGRGCKTNKDGRHASNAAWFVNFFIQGLLFNEGVNAIKVWKFKFFARCKWLGCLEHKADSNIAKMDGQILVTMGCGYADKELACWGTSLGDGMRELTFQAFLYDGHLGLVKGVAALIIEGLSNVEAPSTWERWFYKDNRDTYVPLFILRTRLEWGLLANEGGVHDSEMCTRGNTLNAKNEMKHASPVWKNLDDGGGKPMKKLVKRLLGCEPGGSTFISYLA